MPPRKKDPKSAAAIRTKVTRLNTATVSEKSTHTPVYIEKGEYWGIDPSNGKVRLYSFEDIVDVALANFGSESVVVDPAEADHFIVPWDADWSNAPEERPIWWSLEMLLYNDKPMDVILQKRPTESQVDAVRRQEFEFVKALDAESLVLKKIEKPIPEQTPDSLRMKPRFGSLK